MPAIDEFLNQILESNGSDLHFLAGDPPRIRQYGDLKSLREQPLNADTVKNTLYEIMPKLAVERFEEKDGTDFAYAIPGVARFRVNVMRQLNGMGAVFRAIPSSAKSAEELKLPPVVMDMCKINSGLILVMATLHTNGAAATVDRLVNAFPSDKQPHVRTMLSTSLRGVVSQQLIQKADKQGRVAALEILINTPAVANLIRQGKMDQLENAMQSGSTVGMRLMDTAIQALMDQRQISGKEAFKKAINKSRFEQFREAS